MNKKILVIGGAGYLGTILIEKLREKKYPVRLLDSFIFGKKSIQQFKNDKSVEIIEADIRNIETVNASMKDVDCVLLLAAVVGDPAGASRPAQTVETNYLASQMIASACKLNGINRFIYASTCSVYGIGEHILDEDAPLNPVSLYAKTKISSEQSIMRLVDDSDFSPTIMRMSTLYGYSPRMRFDLVVNTMTKTSFLEKTIHVHGGSQWRPLVHVKDAADAFVKVLESDLKLIKNKIYNVGSEGQNYRITEVAEIISGALNNTPIITKQSDTDARDYRVSFKRIQQDLGFKVKHTIDEAAKEIFKRLKSKEIKDPRQKVYYNHYFDSSEELVG